MANSESIPTIIISQAKYESWQNAAFLPRTQTQSAEQIRGNLGLEALLALRSAQFPIGIILWDLGSSEAWLRAVAMQFKESKHPLLLASGEFASSPAQLYETAEMHFPLSPYILYGEADALSTLVDDETLKRLTDYATLKQAGIVVPRRPAAMLYQLPDFQRHTEHRVNVEFYELVGNKLTERGLTSSQIEAVMPNVADIAFGPLLIQQSKLSYFKRSMHGLPTGTLLPAITRLIPAASAVLHQEKLCSPIMDRLQYSPQISDLPKAYADYPDDKDSYQQFWEVQMNVFRRWLAMR